MTSSATAVREQIREAEKVIQQHVPEYRQCSVLRQYVDGLEDDGVLTFANDVLSPIAQHIRARDIEAIDRLYPGKELVELAMKLPADVATMLWSEVGMLLMLTTTVSMVPPDMLKQIEAFASTMANSMNGADMGCNMNSMFGNILGQPVEGTAPNVQRNRSRPNGKTPQQRFRDRLV